MENLIKQTIHETVVISQRYANTNLLADKVIRSISELRSSFFEGFISKEDDIKIREILNIIERVKKNTDHWNCAKYCESHFKTEIESLNSLNS